MSIHRHINFWTYRIHILHLTINIPLQILINWSLKIQLTLKMNDGIRIDAHHSTAIELEPYVSNLRLMSINTQYPNMSSVYRYYLFMQYMSFMWNHNSDTWAMSNKQESQKNPSNADILDTNYTQSISEWFIWIQWAMHKVSILIRSFFFHHHTNVS